MPRVRFPRDERAHDVGYEWWYANGHLSNEAGRRYGFMYSFFKFKKSAVVRYFPQLRSYPGSTIYQLHLGLTDIAAQTHHADELTFTPWFGHARVGRLKFGVQFGPSYLRSLGPKRYDLHAEHHRRSVDLHMYDEAGPMLHGKAGVMSVRGYGETLYYSLPRLAVDGRIEREDGTPEFVHGRAWIDHQWGDFLPKQPFMYWTWMGVQLDDGGSLMLFEFFDDAGSERALRGTYLSPSGKSRTVTANIRPSHLWKSSKSGVRYPVDHAVEVPALKLTLQVHADVRDQEMHSAFFSYWEGACTVTGTQGKTPISGKAYVEVTNAR